MTYPVEYIHRWHQLIAPRAQVELNRLSIAIKLDAQVYPLVSKAERLSVGFCMDLPYTYGYVAIPCDSEAAALELSQCPQLVEWFAPFRGELSVIVFQFPGGSLPMRPADPRRSALIAAYRCLLPAGCFQGARLHVTDAPWTNGSQLFGSKDPVRVEDYPVLALSVESLRSLNAFYQHWDALHRFAQAAVPGLRHFQCLVSPGQEANPLTWENLDSQWSLSADGQWNFAQHWHSSKALAKGLLFESGLKLPLTSDGQAFERLFVDIKDGALMAFGSTYAVTEIEALIPRIEESLQQLRCIPLLKSIERLALSSPSLNTTIPLTPALTRPTR